MTRTAGDSPRRPNERQQLLSDRAKTPDRPRFYFRNARHGAAVSITTVETLGQAEQTLHALAWLEPADYFMRDCTTGEIIAGRSAEADRQIHR